MPAFRPFFSGVFQQFANNCIAGILRIADRAHGSTVFEFKRDCRAIRVGAANFLANYAIARCCLGDSLVLGWREKKCRMSGENSVKLRHFPQLTEAIEVLGIMARGQCSAVFYWFDRRNQTAQARSAALQRLAFQVCDHRFNIAKIDLSGFKCPRKVKSKLENRIE